MSMLLQTALAAETHLAEGLGLKVRMHVKIRVISDSLSGHAQVNSIPNR
jgi:hypothetical protein